MKLCTWIFCMVLLGCNKPESTHSETIKQIPSASYPIAQKLSPAQQFNVDLQAVKSASGAFQICQSQMTQDIPNAHSVGFGCFAGWIADHPQNFTWQDVFVENETSAKKIFKNQNLEQGKHLCVSGQIVRIQSGEGYTEGLFKSQSVIYHFANPGSSRDLKSGSRSRFCGVVMGVYDFTSSGGSITHSIDMIGIWDLPENK